MDSDRYRAGRSTEILGVRRFSDGTAAVPVRHKGTPPDLFGEGRGAVVEGSWTADGYFKASLIMAKHSEEYKAPHDSGQAGYKELLKTLRGDNPR